MTEKELLADCLCRLNRAAVPYMLTGSMASNYWGIPRTTHDLDFVVQLPERAIPALAEAFAADFCLDPDMIRSAFRPPHQFNAIDTRSALKVDFWLLQPNPFEKTMFARRMSADLFGETAWICTAEDLILHKLYWHKMTPSERQIGDAAGVAAVQAGALDTDYLRRWARELGVADILEDLLKGDIKPKQT
jgi:hypothetical protein